MPENYTSDEKIVIALASMFALSGIMAGRLNQKGLEYPPEEVAEVALSFGKALTNEWKKELAEKPEASDAG